MTAVTVEELEERLPGRVSAPQLGRALLERSSLLDAYPADLSLEVNGAGGEAPRRPSEWIEACEELVPGSSPSAERLFFALAMVSPSFAMEFRRALPDGRGFRRKCEEFEDALTGEQREVWTRLVGTSPTHADRLLHPAMARAIELREAEFSQLAEAFFYRHARFNADPESRDAYGRFYPPLSEAFEGKHGRVTEYYWCSHFVAGVARTEGGRRLHSAGNLPDSAEQLTNECEDLRQTAQEFLTEREYDYVVSNLYTLLTNLLEDLDSRAAKKEEVGPERMKSYGERLREIRRRIEVRMARRGQRWYVGGTALGLLPLAVLLGPLLALGDGDWDRLFLGAIFGALGSIGSVLFRMHRGALKIDASQGKNLVWTAALVRPLMGAIFGAISSAVALGGILSIEVPKAEPDRFYFLCTIAFIAGFSERWAPDLLVVAGQQVGQAKDRPTA